MNSVALMIMNYFHDLAVAVMAVSVITIFILGKYFDRHGADRELPRHLFVRLGRVTWSALAFVIVAGAVRAYYFMDFEWNAAAGAGQIEALVVKHIILVGLTVWGVVGQIRYSRKYGR